MYSSHIICIRIQRSDTISCVSSTICKKDTQKLQAQRKKINFLT